MDCNAEFKRLFHDKCIKEVNMSNPVILEDTYLNVGSTIRRDEDGYAYGQVNKRLRDANGIPIGTVDDNRKSKLSSIQSGISEWI